jgi:hypothetical protein
MVGVRVVRDNLIHLNMILSHRHKGRNYIRKHVGGNDACKKCVFQEEPIAFCYPFLRDMEDHKVACKSWAFIKSIDSLNQNIKVI